jgi:transposase-like protein
MKMLGNGCSDMTSMGRKVSVNRLRAIISRPKKKERIVFEHMEKGVSLQQLGLDYDVSLSAVKRWVRTVRSGVSLYSVKRRGRPPKNTMARPKKKEPQTELEKLQAENLRLRAENALLKKVKALVEEQKARERLSGQEPSAD